jgi:SRSO17 transposase
VTVGGRRRDRPAARAAATVCRGWDADALRDELTRFVAESFGAADGLFLVDETGFLKKGSQSAGCSAGTPGRRARR